MPNPPASAHRPPVDSFLARAWEGLQKGLTRSNLNYDERPGQLRLCIAAIQMDKIAAEPPLWQPALIGASHLQEVTTSFSFQSEPIRDFLGFGASLQVRAADGVSHSLLGDFFIRFVPRPFVDQDGPDNVAFPDTETLTRSFEETFGILAPSVAGNEEEMITEPVSNDLTRAQPLSNNRIAKESAAQKSDPFPIFPPLNVEQPRAQNPQGYGEEEEEKNNDDEHMIVTMPDPQGPGILIVPGVGEHPLSSSTDPTSEDESSDESSEMSMSRSYSPIPPSIDEGFVNVSLEDLVGMKNRSVRSTPEGPFLPDVTPIRYFDMCRELEAFLEGLPTFAYPANNLALDLLEEGSHVDREVVVVPDDAALGQDSLILDDGLSSPLQSELLNTPQLVPIITPAAEQSADHVETPIGVLQIEKEPSTRMIAITKFSPIDKRTVEPTTAGLLTPPGSPTSSAVAAVIGIDPSSFHSAPFPLPTIIETASEAMSDSVPSLLEDSILDNQFIHATNSPVYCPQSPKHTPNPYAEPFIPSSPPPARSDRVGKILFPNVVHEVFARLEVLENAKAVATSTFEDMKGHADYVQGSVNEIRDHHDNLRGNLQDHIASTRGALAELNRLMDCVWDEFGTTKKQLGELVWVFQGVNAAADTTYRTEQRVEEVSSSLEGLKKSRGKSEHFLNVYKREMKGKLDALYAESERNRRTITARAERTERVEQIVDEVRKAQIVDREDWIRELSIIRKTASVDLAGRITAIEHFITCLTQAHQVTPNVPVSTNQDPFRNNSQISAFTVQKVLSALMSTNQPVSCAA